MVNENTSDSGTNLSRTCANTMLASSMFVLENGDMERLRDLLKYIRELMDILEKSMEEE